MTYYVFVMIDVLMRWSFGVWGRRSWLLGSGELSGKIVTVVALFAINIMGISTYIYILGLRTITYIFNSFVPLHVAQIRIAHPMALFISQQCKLEI